MLEEPLPWKHKPFPELVRLAWPIAVSTLSYSAMTLVDTLFVGRLGADALAGVSVGGVFCFTLLCFGFGALRAVKVSVSQAVGAGRRDRITELLGAGLLIALVLGLANVVVGLATSGQIARVAASVATAENAEAYADARVLGAPLAMLAIALREARYGAGDSTTPMRAALVANIANIGLDYLFIVVLGWGVRGAGWASTAAASAECVVLMVALITEGSHRQLVQASALRRTLRSLPRVWRLGVPMGLQMLLEVSVFALLTAIFASMSAVDVAAHQIGMQVIHFSFLPAFALGEAASVLAGQAVGARQPRLVRGVARSTLALAVAYTGVCGIGMALLGRQIAGAFTTDPELVRTAHRLLLVAAVFQVFDGANIVARSVLRGVGDVRFSAMISVGIAWVVTPPVALFVGYGLGYGVLGGWLGFCAEIILGAGVLWWRLERGGWKQAAARERAALEADDPPPSSRGGMDGPPPKRDTVAA